MRVGVTTYKAKYFCAALCCAIMSDMIVNLRHDQESQTSCKSCFLCERQVPSTVHFVSVSHAYRQQVEDVVSAAMRKLDKDAERVFLLAIQTSGYGPDPAAPVPAVILTLFRGCVESGFGQEASLLASSWRLFEKGRFFVFRVASYMSQDDWAIMHVDGLRFRFLTQTLEHHEAQAPCFTL